MSVGRVDSTDALWAAALAVATGVVVFATRTLQ